MSTVIEGRTHHCA